MSERTEQWAGWHTAEGGCKVRPLFEGEPMGRPYTGPLQAHEFLIEVPAGTYPDKLAHSTPEYKARHKAEVAEAEARAAFDPYAEIQALKTRIAALEPPEGR